MGAEQMGSKDRAEGSLLWDPDCSLPVTGISEGKHYWEQKLGDVSRERQCGCLILHDKVTNKNNDHQCSMLSFPERPLGRRTCREGRTVNSSQAQGCWLLGNNFRFRDLVLVTAFSGWGIGFFFILKNCTA